LSYRGSSKRGSHLSWPARSVKPFFAARGIFCPIRDSIRPSRFLTAHRISRTQMRLAACRKRLQRHEATENSRGQRRTT